MADLLKVTHDGDAINVDELLYVRVVSGFGTFTEPRRAARFVFKTGVSHDVLLGATTLAARNLFGLPEA